MWPAYPIQGLGIFSPNNDEQEWRRAKKHDTVKN